MGTPLISVIDLQQCLADVTVLDVRYRLGSDTGPAEHAEGHIPGAAYVDLDRDLAGPPGTRGRHPLPEPGVFVAAMRRAGVWRARPVVVYDDWAGLAAARAWWLLRHYGHPDVRLLDGSWPAWVAAGGAVEAGAGEGGEGNPPPGDFDGRPGSMPVREAAQIPTTGVLIDARAPERFRGEHEPIDPVAGHIPGAVNVPTVRNLDNHGHLRDRHELAAVYAEVGAVPGADVAAYCGSGVTAAQTVLALELVGIPAALYPGSWSEWIVDPTRPVAT